MIGKELKNVNKTNIKGDSEHTILFTKQIYRKDVFYLTMIKKSLIFILLWLLLLSTTEAQPKLVIERLEVSNDYVFNNPLIKVFLKNAGNETTSILNESLDMDKGYILYSKIPDKIEPGDVLTIVFKVDEMLCEDYHQMFNFTSTIFYTSGSETYNTSSSNYLFPENPLTFMDVSPDPEDGFAIYLGESDSMIFSVVNKGLREMEYNFNIPSEPELLYLKFSDLNQNYDLREFVSENFTLSGGERHNYRLKLIPSGLRSNYLEIILENSLGCESIEDTINTLINVHAKVNNIVKVIITPGIKFSDVFILMLFSSFLFFFKAKTF